MKTTQGGNSRKLAIATLMGLALSTTLFAGITHAQAPGQDPTQNGGGRAGRQGRGGFAGQMPFTSGKVVTGDAAAGTITITAQNGSTQIIHVTQDTKFVTQKTIKAEDLKVGDKVQVAGVPTSISASTITAGDLPDFLPGANRGRGARGGNNAAPGAGGAQTANPADPNAPPAPPPATANATGTVVGLNPLMISLSDEVTISLKIKPDAKINRYADTKYSDLHPGDTLTASGQSAPDGSFNATGIGVNITNTGGRGAGFGPGGAGGPGGGGFGPGGGNGGGGGGRRGGRGGGGGNGGGAGGN